MPSVTNRNPMLYAARRARFRRINAMPSTVPTTTPTLVRAASPPTTTPSSPNTSPTTTLPITQPTRMSTTQPTMRVNLRGLVIVTLVAAVVLLGACGGDDGPSGEEKAIGAKSKLSEHDGEILANLGQHTARWNEVVGPVHS